MVSILKELQGGARREAFAERFEELQMRELVSRSMQEEHGDLHFKKVFGALVGRLGGRMKREAKEHQAANAR
jgi:hypothetical protein